MTGPGAVPATPEGTVSVIAGRLTTVTADDVEGAVLAYRELQDWEPVLDDLGAAEYLGVKTRQEPSAPARLLVLPYRPGEFAVMRKGDRYLEIARGKGAATAPEIDAPARPAVDRTVEIAGCAVYLRHWPAGDGGGGGRMLLVHGTRANTHWWDHVARLLSPQVDCTAIDLSGNGRSSRRPRYTPALWAEEVRVAASSGRSTLVGHSMGGRLALIAAARYPELFDQVVIVDTLVHPMYGDGERFRPDKRVYEDLDVAVGRFRLLPPQPWPRGASLRQLAVDSLERDAGGWSWRFDPAAVGVLDDAALLEALPRVACPVHVVRASESPLTSPGDALFLHNATGQHTTDTVVGGAFHHIPLDSPAQLAWVLEQLLERGISESTVVYG